MTGGTTVIVTGSTGFLGGFLTAALLRRGCRVISLVRPRNGSTPWQRMGRLMDFFGLRPGDDLEVVEAYLDEPGLGITEELAGDLRERADHIFHCAADTSFAARRSDEVLRTNVQGLMNVYGILSGSSHFHHMSTAYAAGAREGTCMERLEETGAFHNDYERSKHIAEVEITGACRRDGTRLSIYRPSIVYGDSVTGRSLRFSALYYPVRILLFLRDGFIRDIRERGGSRAEELGVSMGPDGSVTMPMTIPHREGWMNLIPVDHLVRTIMELMSSGAEGIFHIVNHRQNTLDDLLDLIGDHFGLDGISSVTGDRPGGPTPLEVLLDGYIKLYYPYMTDRRRFDDSGTRKRLDGMDLVCPQLDAASFGRCMDYAVEMEWGSRLRI